MRYITVGNPRRRRDLLRAGALSMPPLKSDLVT
jgi:hypothetical protein